MTELVFVVGVRTRNPLNGGTGNSRLAGVIRARERARQRSSARACTLAAIRSAGVHPAALIPVRVQLTRLSAGRMDDDGLAASQKGVRDGIAEALGIDDGSSFIRFAYAQRKVARGVFGVEVRLSKAQ